MLYVKVIRAVNLKKMDIMGKSDPYVKLKMTGDRLQSKKTTVKMSNLNPEWNEVFTFAVKDPNSQVLEIHAYDWDKVLTSINFALLPSNSFLLPFSTFLLLSSIFMFLGHNLHLCRLVHMTSWECKFFL
jgi:hypothetical protein